MRFVKGTLSLAVLACGLAFTAPVHADAFVQDHVYADSFGNLVVYSPGGYKRVVVGQGHLAGELSAYSAGVGGPAYAEEPGVEYLPGPRCRRAPGRVQGRSYMYGIPDHVVPVPSAGCL